MREEVRLRLPRPHDAVKLQLAPTLVRARRVDVDMIFRNLLDNAFKYAGTPPLVEVALCPQDGERVLVEIRDNGLGIPARIRKRSFGGSYGWARNWNARSREPVWDCTFSRRWSSGCGTVRVRDQERGPGTIFEVSLPRIENKSRALRPLTRKCNSRS